MTTAYKQSSKCYYPVIRGLAFEETIKVFRQDSCGSQSPLDLTGKSISINFKTSQDAITIALGASTFNGKLVAGNGSIVMRLFSRAESASLPIKELTGVLVIEDSPTRDIPLLFITLKPQDGY